MAESKGFPRSVGRFDLCGLFLCVISKTQQERKTQYGGKTKYCNSHASLHVKI